jgi:hypothetical protein
MDKPPLGHSVNTTKANRCAQLHEILEPRPLFSHPFSLSDLPAHGIYFFYEEGEIGIHFGSKPRVVNVGTHRGDNFGSRISEHFLLDEKGMKFTADQPAPRDRSILRRHIGSALLNKASDPYLPVWELDFTKRKNRDEKKHLRDIAKEVEIENEVSRILRDTFSFRFIEIADENERMGSEGLKSALIGTLSGCDLCLASSGWLGKHSPTSKIRESGLWLMQSLKANPLSEDQLEAVRSAAQSGFWSG